MNVQVDPDTLTAKDFTTDQDVRWCPGCGDYAILKAVQKTLPELGVRPEKTVFVSGIGCAARFPYYMATYGFHTIHGRAPAVATGVKLANPDLDVWVVSGDGDALSIGGNHLLHVLRRNVDLQFLLFNNEVYGLTKGQYSPTSRLGQRTPSTPQGSIDSPLNACVLAIGAGARFVARGIDIQAKPLSEVLKAAYRHKGASFVEIIQNCVVFNEDAFADFTEKAVAADTQLHVVNGEPLIFGKEKNKGIHFSTETLTLEVGTIGEDGFTEDDVLTHDETNPVIAHMLAGMDLPTFPVAMGVLYQNPAPSYEGQVSDQMDAVKAKAKGKGDIDALLRSGNTWTVN